MSAQPTSRTDDAAPGAVARVLSWLRAGYPAGVPRGDYVALLGLLRRKLTDTEVRLIADELVGMAQQGEVITTVDVERLDEGDIVGV